MSNDTYLSLTLEGKRNIFKHKVIQVTVSIGPAFENLDVVINSLDLGSEDPYTGIHPGQSLQSKDPSHNFP